MKDARQIAEEAALQSFLNCYIRETSAVEWLPADAEQSEGLNAFPAPSPTGVYASCRLARQGITVQAGIRHRSAVGRHLFEFPLYYRTSAEAAWNTGDYITVTALLIKELTLASGADVRSDELLLRVIQSCRSTETFVAGRSGDAAELYGPQGDFIAAEQSLLFGHLIHPTPKSRQGIPDEQIALYSPELKGSFALHYFRAARELVREDSTLAETATELVKRELREDPLADPAFVARYCGADEAWSLIPVHPLQAEKLLAEPFVQAWIASGKLMYVGACGSPYAATSSLRTVYRESSRFMYKFSLQVKVTNSLRVNKFKELERGVEVDRLLATAVGEVCRQFPAFDIVRDPAYLTLAAEGREESGFEVSLRANPFRGAGAVNATLVAGLVQDALPGSPSRLGGIIRGLAAKEGRSTEEISLGWFRRYLDMSLRPMIWLYLRFGIALEAHQQNSVVQLDAEGYPQRFYYRDNQGYYFCASTKALLERELPGIGQASQTVCEDAVADERFRYYLIMNHMFGVINGFGSARLTDERDLLNELRAALAGFIPMDRAPSRFLHSLLNDPVLPCKANLLTRLHDMDELVGAMEAQSVYVDIDNPLVKEAHGRGFDSQQQHVLPAR